MPSLRDLWNEVPSIPHLISSQPAIFSTLGTSQCSVTHKALPCLCLV